MREPKQCKSFVPCSKCKHVKFCSKSASHAGYCGKSSKCIPLCQFSSYCITCLSFSDLNSYYFGFNDPADKPPLNPEAEEKRKMMEFFFPKQNKPKNPGDPWEFL